MLVEIKLAYNCLEKIKELFKEYTDMLVKEDEKFAKYLKMQDYDLELENLQIKYGIPLGRLYLATVEGEVAGCIALRYVDKKTCELKRLYVKPEFRGNQIGDVLIEQIIDDAKEIGYKKILLDTLPFLKSAIHLYEKYGFYEILPYNNSPIENSIYYRLDL
ncbi:MAG: GNAT family N-acetyltransferase [Terrisporobacter sp.]|uniref:GNAT family N-acetyltransferase n=1 Tax=Terrisporobacter sp. TaxID=1965305 RepID=UPI0025EEA793|nr:GNAT family N-acetyltransferase [uncultured Terrisporobacter sp.]